MGSIPVLYCCSKLAYKGINLDEGEAKRRPELSQVEELFVLFSSSDEPLRKTRCASMVGLAFWTSLP